MPQTDFGGQILAYYRYLSIRIGGTSRSLLLSLRYSSLSFMEMNDDLLEVIFDLPLVSLGPHWLCMSSAPRHAISHFSTTCIVKSWYGDTCESTESESHELLNFNGRIA
jgi:hypothetical protein